MGKISEFRNVTLRERISEEIVRLILSGELPRGSQINERALAEQLSVSRTPFREAVGTLAKEGLIETRPYRGTFVRDFAPKEVHDLFEVRKVLESMAVRIGVPLLTDNDIVIFEEILDAAVDSLRRGDLHAYAEHDSRFHEKIAQLSQNRTLIETLARLSVQIQVCRVMANHDPDVVERTAAERSAILQAFRARNSERAAALMEEHIAGVQRSIAPMLGRQAS